jgi:hypothetical protein
VGYPTKALISPKWVKRKVKSKGLSVLDNPFTRVKIRFMSGLKERIFISFAGHQRDIKGEKTFFRQGAES